MGSPWRLKTHGELGTSITLPLGLQEQLVHITLNHSDRAGIVVLRFALFQGDAPVLEIDLLPGDRGQLTFPNPARCRRESGCSDGAPPRSSLGSGRDRPGGRPGRSPHRLPSRPQASRPAADDYAGRVRAESLCPAAHGHAERIQLPRARPGEDPIVPIFERHRRTGPPSREVPRLGDVGFKSFQHADAY